MKVGFIGVGVMGRPMSLNVAKEFEVCAYDVNADALRDLPYKTVGSVKELVDYSDVVITMVPKNEHAIAVYDEILEGLDSEKIFIDMSTISPSVHKSIVEKVEAAGSEMIEAPVVKSQAAAISANLGIYVGGKEEVFEKVRKVLECMGKDIIYLGTHGTGLTMKILHNTLVGEIQNGVNEVMDLAKASGIDLNDFKTAISYGGGQNFYLDGKAKNIIEENFPTAFSVRNMHKDMHLADDLMNDVNQRYPGIENVIRVYDEAMEKGLGGEDFSASYKVVKK